jgi:hypothetical protein
VHTQEVAANKFIQERFIPKLVAAGITTVVDVVRRPDENSHPGAAIVKKADEIEAAVIVLTPHEHEFVEVRPQCNLWLRSDLSSVLELAHIQAQ